MCGLNGIFAYNASASLPEEGELIAIRDHMVARGPDGCGEWWSRDRRLGLGHRRLSIVDLSDRALQPMASADGRYHVVFNGEIYNYPELRKELEAEGVQFRTTSDTEALLHLYARDGASMVHRLRGMFAFAIWDDKARGIFLARDPYGIKPLYTANDGWTFRFASQVKALLAGGRISRDPEPAGVVGFHLWGSVPEPFTLYREIRSLPSGHTQWVDEAGPRLPVAYASIAAILAEGARATCQADEVVERVRAGALDSVRAHLLGDVEVGLFLSAGIDSGALLGLMRDARQERVRCVTLSFDEFRGTSEDEAPLAAEVAKNYGADHLVRRVSESEFLSDLPAIMEAMDQPSLDGVNTWFVAKAARECGLKVALSGIGGDELLAGYPSFRCIPRWVALLRAPSAVPGLARIVRLVGKSVGALKLRPKALGLLEYGGNYPGAYMLLRGLFLPFELRDQLDNDLLSAGLRRLKPLQRLRAQGLTPEPKSPISRVAAIESSWYLRHQLLRDSDWAGMAHSVEIRTPLVDIALLKALASAVPNFRNADGKAALAHAPSRPLPGDIVKRAKTGFRVPTGRWAAAVARGSKASKYGDARSWALSVFARSTVASAPVRSAHAVGAVLRSDCEPREQDQPRAHGTVARHFACRDQQQPASSGGRLGSGHRILALVTEAFGGYGGIAQYNRDLMTAIAEMTGIAQIDVLPRLGGSKVEEIPSPIRQHVAINGRLSYAATALSLAIQIRPTIVYSGHLYHGPLAQAVAQLVGARLVSQVHGTEIWGKISARNRRSVERSDVVLTVSRDTRARVISRFDVEPERTVVLNNTVGDDFCPGDRLVARSRWALSDDLAILTVARLDAREGYKGHDRLIPLVARLRSLGLPITYLIAGAGDDQARLEALAATSGAGENVRFLGKVLHEMLPDLYRAADVFAMPSTGEGFGIAFLEAMACGTPSIGLAVGGAPDALADGQLGSCVSVEVFPEELEKVLRAARSSASELSKRVKDQFGHAAFRTRVAQILGQLLGQSRQSHIPLKA